MQDIIKIQDAELEILRFGSGPPLLLLESEDQLERDLPIVKTLAKDFEIVIPSPPGFGTSNRPDWISTIDDISYLYLDILRLLDLQQVNVIGFSLGGWLAAELATKNDSRLKNLVLVAPYGVKHGGPEDRDIADIWILDPPDITRRMWHDPSKDERDFPSMPDDVLHIVARNRETFARFCWQPYMHNPKLKKRLHNIQIPTHFIWGAQDGIVDTSYAKQYQDAVPGAGLSIIDKAGHFPHIEQPEKFLNDLRKVL